MVWEFGNRRVDIVQGIPLPRRSFKNRVAAISADLEAEREEVVEAGRKDGFKWATEDGDLDGLKTLKKGKQSQHHHDRMDVQQLLEDKGIRGDFRQQLENDEFECVTPLWNDYMIGFIEGAVMALEQAIEQTRQERG